MDAAGVRIYKARESVRIGGFQLGKLPVFQRVLGDGKILGQLL